MKFAIVLVLSLVALSSAHGHGHGDEHGHGNNADCKSEISANLNGLGQCLQKNATTYSAFVSALQASSSLSQYVSSVNGTQTVNFSAIAANYFTSVPQLASILSQLGLSNKTQSLATAIDQVQNNRTILNQFIGVLYLNNQTSFLSGTAGQEAVNFSAVLADSNASQLLACFILKQSHDGDHHSGERHSGEKNNSGSHEKKGKKGH